MRRAPPLERFGRYELIERIGAGGMAEVFRARSVGPLGFERELVVKRIRPEYADDAMIVQMFGDEAKLAASANHRNVVQVFELGATEDGQVFMAMEHVVGTDLKEVQLRAYDHDRRIPPWFSVHVVAEVLSALTFMHELVDAKGRRRNIVHRDVSPENIFISELGDVKLGDFGIAKDDTRPDALHGREVKGKPGYSAPEHTAGLVPDQRFDVFSAGVVLWECLTQRPLLAGSDPNAVLERQAPELTTPPSRYARDIPAELDGIVLRALAPEPETRTPTTSAMRRELLDLLMAMRPGHIDASEVAAIFRQLVTVETSAALAASPDEALACEEELPEVQAADAPSEVSAPVNIGNLEPIRRRFEDGRTYSIISRPRAERVNGSGSATINSGEGSRIRRLVI